MIKEVRVGDLLRAEAQTLVNTVNCVGVMGKGIALEFKRAFPDMYDDYVARCKAGQVRLGEPYLYRRLFPPHILNFPTKQDWRSVSRLEDIVRGLGYLAQHYRGWEIESLAVPPLGCGSGGLEWRVVGPTLYRHLNRLDIPVFLYAPFSTPETELAADFLAGAEVAHPSAESAEHVLPGWVALVEILSRIEREPFRWPMGRVMFQKLAYFAMATGIPTGLEYERGSYGPFAPGLKSVASKLINNGLIREKSLGRMFSIEVGSTYSDARRAYAKQLDEWRDKMDLVADLLLRMSSHQAEVAATVHFAAQDLPADATENTLLTAVMQWKQRRQPAWDETEVASTIRNLAALGWIKVRPGAKLPLPEYDDIFA